MTTTVQENLWDLVVKFFYFLVAILIMMFIKTAYNVYHIPSQLRKVQDSLEKAMIKHQALLKEHEGSENLKEIENEPFPTDSNDNTEMEKNKDL